MLEHTELVANHDDFVKEGFDGHSFFLGIVIPRLHDDFAPLPAIAELGVRKGKLFVEHLAEHASKFVDVHIDVDLFG